MPKPKQKRIIVLQSSKHDSGSGSLRDAIASSQDESTESEGRDSLTGEGYSKSGMSNDILIGGYSEISPLFEIITLPPQPPYPRPSFTETIDGELFSSGASPVDATLLLPSIQRSREAVSEFSGVSSVETTFTSISVNNTLRVIL
jgi:hypothetical protein